MFCRKFAKYRNSLVLRKYQSLQMPQFGSVCERDEIIKMNGFFIISFIVVKHT